MFWTIVFFLSCFFALVNCIDIMIRYRLIHCKDVHIKFSSWDSKCIGTKWVKIRLSKIRRTIHPYSESFDRKFQGGKKMKAHFALWLIAWSPTSILVRDHSSITSSKRKVGGWGQKMAIFDDLQYCKSSTM